MVDPNEPEHVCVFEPWTPEESVLAESILSGSGIAYHIENECASRGALFGMAGGRVRVIVHANLHVLKSWSAANESSEDEKSARANATNAGSTRPI